MLEWTAEADLGEINIVMNNAGSIVNGHPEDIPLDEWQRLMDLDFFSVVRSNIVFLPKFLTRGSGHIVNTASVAGLFPFADSRMPYAAAKAANISLTQNLAIYLEPKGIRVSATTRRSASGEICRLNGCSTPEPEGRATHTIRP